MSGCTVLAMAIVSANRGKNDDLDMNLPVTLPLAIGGAIGGIVGKSIFNNISGDKAFMQSTFLFAIYVGIYFYVKVKTKMKSMNVTNKGMCVFIGLSLGSISSFLGIGGGPINMAVLFFFFAGTPKVAAKQSIFLIMLSQSASFITVLITGLPQQVNWVALGLMIIGGCGGAIYGSKLSQKFSDK